MKPSNPATHFISGSDQSSFVFTPGKHLHYAIARKDGAIILHVLMLADDEAHVRRILVDMLYHWKGCNECYATHFRAIGNGDRNDFVRRTQRRYDQLFAVLHGNDSAALHIGLADPHQMFMVGWAANDTLA